MPRLGPRLAPFLRVVREPGPLGVVAEPIRSPTDAWRAFRVHLDPEPVECFDVIFLDTQHRPIGRSRLTRGTVDSSLVYARDVYAEALIHRASGILIAHNHPSGDPTPSPDDRAITRSLVEAGRLLDIPLFDHIICGHDRYFSFSEAGLL
jgi:DNA repair protein RadC